MHGKEKHVGKPKYFDFECLIEKRKKRKLERKMKLDKSETNVSLYTAQLLKYRNVLARKRDEFFTMNFNNSNSRILFNNLNDLINHRSNVLPAASCTYSLANSFNAHFQKQIRDIIEAFELKESSFTKISDSTCEQWSFFKQIDNDCLIDTVSSLSN